MNRSSDIQSLLANCFPRCLICKSKAKFSKVNKKKAENPPEEYKQFLEFLAWKKTNDQ